MKTTSLQDQISGSIIADFNIRRVQEKIAQINLQDACFMKATEQIDIVREFISEPSKILGSVATKHGEIAEQVEVQIRRSQDALYNNEFSATFEGVGRTAPEDYLINNVAVQSKFINGLNNNLTHVMDHMDKYSNFGRDGSYYHIPKDHFETILKIHNGEMPEELSQKTVNAIKDKIEEIQIKSGKPFTEVVKPGISDYAEVQQGAVSQTLDKHQQDLMQQNEELKEAIQEKYQASISEGVKAATAAAAVGAGLSLGTSLYIKYREGKNVFRGELTSDDWKEIGLKVGITSVGAGLTGAAIYGLTNCAGLAAPIAGSFVTATKGLKSLVQDLHQEKITFVEFQANAIYLCADSAGVGLATLVGQMVIPIPILGSVIGSLAGKLACNLLFGEDRALARKMEESMQEFLGDINQKYMMLFEKINAEFKKIADFRRIAFDFNSNLDIVERSIDLANLYNVPDVKILKNEDDLRKFLFE